MSIRVAKVVNYIHFDSTAAIVSDKTGTFQKQHSSLTAAQQAMIGEHGPNVIFAADGKFSFAVVVMEEDTPKGASWTKRDSAHTNAIDTCKEEGLSPGTDAWEAKYAEIYKATLAMLQDDTGGLHFTPECAECEAAAYPTKCFKCHMAEVTF